jgi:hypothetical protein
MSDYQGEHDDYFSRETKEKYVQKRHSEDSRERLSVYLVCSQRLKLSPNALQAFRWWGLPLAWTFIASRWSGLRTRACPLLSFGTFTSPHPSHPVRRAQFDTRAITNRGGGRKGE